MRVGKLKIPERLVSLVDAGQWPGSPAYDRRPWADTRISKERVRRIAPDEHEIFLYSPPFRTVADNLTGAEAPFSSEFGALSEIEPAAAVLIADFGLGSDAPIILDYREHAKIRRVLRLCWLGDPERTTHWLGAARTFDDFADRLGLP